MYALVILEGPDAGARFPLPEREPQLIGRSTEAVPLHDSSVSRRHAELTPDGEDWWIRDLESRNGTFLNETRILERTCLHAGDRVRCGDTVMQFVHLDETPDHGRVHTVEPAPGTVRLGPGPATPADRMPQLFALIEGDVLDPGSGLPLVCRLMHSEEAALLELPGPDDTEGPTTVRTAEGRIPRAPFELPPELLRATLGGRGPRTADMDPSRRIAAVCARRPDGGGVVLAVARSSAAEWTDSELELLSVCGTRFAISGQKREEVEDLDRLQRLAAMGEATAALSHAIRNIVQGLRGGTDAVQLALNRERIDLAREGWTILSRNLDRILALSLNMLAYSKDRELDLMLTDVGRLLSDAIELLRTSAERSRVEIDLALDEDVPPIALDPDALHQIVINLVRNAIDASPTGGRISVGTRYRTDPVRLVVDIEDQGPGVPAERRDRIFEPFFSTKGQRGTGLGLAVARKLTERHGGSLGLVDKSDPGALFRIVLPADRAATADPEKTRGPNPIQGGDLGIRFEA